MRRKLPYMLMKRGKFTFLFVAGKTWRGPRAAKAPKSLARFAGRYPQRIKN